MSGDYKWDMQVIAEELAEKLYGKDFYDLDRNTQYAVYTQATQQYVERLCDRGDYLRKAKREGAA
jgi:hypothetical protein